MLNSLLSPQFSVLGYIAIATLICCFVTAPLLQENKKYMFFPDVERGSVASSTIRKFVVFGLLLAFICIWAWIVFFPINFGHRDEIAYLPVLQPPQIVMGRFFPLGHLEFNVFSLKLFNGYLGGLYLLPLVQIALFVFFVYKIVNPTGLIVKVYSLCFSFILAAIVPLSNLIIPERNAIIFLLAGIYFVKRYNFQPTLKNALAAIIFCSISLYYKEPVFSFLATFAVLLVFYKLIAVARIRDSNSIQHSYIRAFGPIEIGLILASAFFLLGYYLYVFYRGGPDSFYGGVSASVTVEQYLERISFYVFDVPILLSLIIISIGSHCFIGVRNFERGFAVGIALGGACYLIALTVLGMYLNGYYYSIPLLAMVLSSAILLKYIPVRNFRHLFKRPYMNIRDVSSILCLVLLLFLLATVAFKQVKPVIVDLLQKKRYQSEYTFLEETLYQKGEIKSVYYAPTASPYNDYSTAILMIFLHNRDLSHNFVISSDSGCAVYNQEYNGGLIKCRSKSYNKFDDYDVIVVEGDSITDLDTNKYELFKHSVPLKLWGNPRTLLVAILKKGVGH